MVQNRRLARNAFANVLQTIAVAGLLFALYRFINTTLGVDNLGVWSVVLATASASRLADMGLSSGVVRFVARDRARDDLDRAGQVVDTTVLTIMGSVGAVLPLLYPLLTKLLPHLFHANYLVQALAILPYALISLWLTIVSAVFQGGLDGCQRMDLRAGMVIVGQALMLVLAFWLVPQHGLVGLALAQIGQGLFLTIAGRVLLRHVLPTLPWLPRHWHKHVLREMLGYGANLQAATLFMLLLDPVTNALMARFGGPAAAGYFAMANQVVLKVRSVIVTANRAVVPHVAALTEGKSDQLGRLYSKNISVLAFVMLPSFSLLFAWAGGFSWLLAGEYHPDFVFLLGLFSLAWGVNILSGPAYFTNMGTGHVGWNTLSHFIIGVLNVSLGWLLGNLNGVNGVVFAYAIALVTGSGVLISVAQHRNRVGRLRELFHEHLWLIAACAVVVALGWIEPLRPLTSVPSVLAAGLGLPPLVLGLAVWFHPMRRRFLGWMRSGLQA